MPTVTSLSAHHQSAHCLGCLAVSVATLQRRHTPVEANDSAPFELGRAVGDRSAALAIDRGLSVRQETLWPE
eukprot:scaffold67829_cov16-Prasinocladus_malaysianus.AAC.2